MRIRAAVWPGAGSGTVLLFPGRTEHIEKYGPTAARLVSRGFSTVVIDWRGQGLSDRSPGAGMLGHVKDFKDYQNDLQAVLQLAAVQDLTGPRYLFCHSMGGCIGLRSLLDGFEVERAVFSAPMWGLGLSAFQTLFLQALSFAAGLTGLSRKLGPRQQAEPYILRNPAEGNVLTSDAQTYTWFRRHLEIQPELALGGPTIGWLGAALRETRALADAAPPTLPVLALLGTAERVVSTGAIKRQIARMPDASLAGIDGARHENWMESEARQAQVWQRIDAFLARK